MIPLGLTLVLVVGAPGPKAPAKPAAAHPLVGKYTVESHTRNGRSFLQRPATVELTADRWVYREKSEADAYLKVDAAKGEFDVWLPSTGNTPPTKCLGVYKQAGETLAVHYTMDGERPGTVSDAPAADVYVMVLKRMKD